MNPPARWNWSASDRGPKTLRFSGKNSSIVGGNESFHALSEFGLIGRLPFEECRTLRFGSLDDEVKERCFGHNVLLLPQSRDWKRKHVKRPKDFFKLAYLEELRLHFTVSKDRQPSGNSASAARRIGMPCLMGNLTPQLQTRWRLSRVSGDSRLGSMGQRRFGRRSSVICESLNWCVFLTV